MDRAAQGFERLDELVRSRAPEDWDRSVSRPEGKDPWTVKDTLAHITGATATFARMLRREPPWPEERLDVPNMNHAVYERWRGRPWQEVVAWHREVQEVGMKALPECAEEVFTGHERACEWPTRLERHSAAHRRRGIVRARGTGRRPANLTEAKAAAPCGRAPGSPGPCDVE